MAMLFHCKKRNMLSNLNRCHYGLLGQHMSHILRGNDTLRPFSSFFSNSPALVGQYIAPDKNLKVMIFDPKKDRCIWEEYLRNMDKAYTEYGCEVERDDHPDKIALMAVAVDRRDNKDHMVGGFRIEGPFDKATDIPAVKTMKGIVGSTLIIDRINELCYKKSSLVVMEAKGFWTNRMGVSHVLGRAITHLKWMLDVDYVAGCAASYATEIYQRIGYDRENWLNLPKNEIPTFAYPDERYETSQMMMTPRYMDILDADTRQLIRYEQRVLAPAKDRFLKRKQEQQKEESRYVHKPPHISGVQSNNKHNDSYLPEILVDDDVRVQELRDTLGIIVVDHFSSMMKELTDGILPKVTDHLLLEEPPHWVYLPWRHTLLRMLGPKGFKRLRTDRNRYKLTLEEMHQLENRSVGVVGMSVGHTCAVGLAQEALCGHLNLADFDTLELSNLNRIPTSITELGFNKTTMTARRIAEIDPYLTVNVYKDGVTEENIEEFVKHMDCVVEECDSLDIKVLTRHEAAKQRTPLIMETSDFGLLDVERYDIDPNRTPFHGLARGAMVPQVLKGLSTEDKIPFVLDILELEKLSPRLVASLMEVNRSISSWPQLARDVALGGALVSTAVHKLFLDPASLPSGRSRTDLNGALTRLEDPLISLPTAISTRHSPIIMKKVEEQRSCQDTTA